MGWIERHPGVIVFGRDEEGRLAIDPDSFASLLPEAAFEPSGDGLEVAVGLDEDEVLTAERPVESSWDSLRSPP